MNIETTGTLQWVPSYQRYDVEKTVIAFLWEGALFVWRWNDRAFACVKAGKVMVISRQTWEKAYTARQIAAH